MHDFSGTKSLSCKHSHSTYFHVREFSLFPFCSFSCVPGAFWTRLSDIISEFPRVARQIAARDDDKALARWLAGWQVSYYICIFGEASCLNMPLKPWKKNPYESKVSKKDVDYSPLISLARQQRHGLFLEVILWFFARPNIVFAYLSN